MPHEAPHNAQRVTYAIGKVDVPCVDRYKEGQTLTAFEAAALNQLVQENTRNNLHQRWKSEDAKGEGKSAAERLAQAIDYQTEYQFGVRRAGRPTGTTHDPVRVEALNIIVRAIKNQLVAKGKPVKGKAEAIAKQAQTILDSDSAFALKALESAREYVEQMQALTADDVGDLAELETAPAEVEAETVSE